MSNINFGKETVTDRIIVNGIPLDRHTTKCFQDGKVVGTSRTKYEQSIFTERASLMKDVIESMEIVTRDLTRSLTLEITVKEDGRIWLKKIWQA
jgi:hypothetical protein